jgi:hypothetical protein
LLRRLVQGAQNKTDAELDEELVTLRHALAEDKGQVRSAVEAVSGRHARDVIGVWCTFLVLSVRTR